ncbi:NAD(P)H-quinone oxidoreductase [Rhodococcus sp. D2-41]|uniref:NAD(P)H-quinone oxidoreductase n=1 Tax=Speluncibacter jeojiensis TaxID=2710754 RepID=A0A9X4LZB4_9ACTN|nr:NAD(P)H-quinone oxidoreductase [Rhodococcus sp. D2-41]MDG3010408.1 NAD(P)H-quinone oxidoreductase [Rhodococcus sp. D2-41]MDG3014155.1 NAD(P)H-quinone oxidoreductase [Corynebacteriales bacterium D3-21]
MYAITLSGFGDPDVMSWSEQPDPSPGPGEVIVDVAATAVNRADVMQRLGFYPPPPGESEILGLECSGVISELGAGVTRWHVGDRVCALVAGGGYAERVAVPVTQLMPIPAGLDLHVAASLPEVACTVWSNLVMAAGMRSGQLLLVHGGAGGIGTHAIQVATALGVRVAVTAGSDEKLARCRELGAEITVNYRTEDFVEAIKAATAGSARPGADLILDNMGAKYLARNLDALAPDGQLVIIGMQGGRTAELDLSALMAKRARVLATGLRTRPRIGPSGKAEIAGAVVDRVWPLISEGLVQPVVHAELPVAEAAAAHRLLDSGEVVGKIVLVVRN